MWKAFGLVRISFVAYVFAFVKVEIFSRRLVLLPVLGQCDAHPPAPRVTHKISLERIHYTDWQDWQPASPLLTPQPQLEFPCKLSQVWISPQRANGVAGLYSGLVVFAGWRGCALRSAAPQQALFTGQRWLWMSLNYEQAFYHAALNGAICCVKIELTSRWWLFSGHQEGRLTIGWELPEKALDQRQQISCEFVALEGSNFN